jgi:hypothetical protein
MILQLEVFVWDEGNQKLIDMGETPKGDIEEDDYVVDFTFYSIDFVHRYKDFYCVIGSGSEMFTINEDYNSVQEKIKEQMHFRFN